MKNLFGLIFVGLFICCTSNVKKDVDSKTYNLIPASPRNNVDEVLCMEDSLVKILLKNGVMGLQGVELIYDPDIKFTSGYSDDFLFTHYQLSYKKNNIEFIDTVYQRSKVDKRNLYLNKKRLNVCKIKNNLFNLDSMEMHVVYTESEIYTFRNNPFYLLIVSHPMNWVGRMSSFSFFQLINSKEKTVTEFVREGE